MIISSEIVGSVLLSYPMLIGEPLRKVAPGASLLVPLQGCPLLRHLLLSSPGSCHLVLLWSPGGNSLQL